MNLKLSRQFLFYLQFLFQKQTNMEGKRFSFFEREENTKRCWWLIKQLQFLRRSCFSLALCQYKHNFKNCKITMQFRFLIVSSVNKIQWLYGGWRDGIYHRRTYVLNSGSLVQFPAQDQMLHVSPPPPKALIRLMNLPHRTVQMSYLQYKCDNPASS